MGTLSAGRLHRSLCQDVSTLPTCLSLLPLKQQHRSGDCLGMSSEGSLVEKMLLPLMLHLRICWNSDASDSCHFVKQRQPSHGSDWRSYRNPKGANCKPFHQASPVCSQP